ncbi:4-hydroxythreonine-4-phosphate dehydrogenase PdxA, partial [Escherichia coli]
LAGAPVVVVGCVRTLRRIMAMNITPQAELRVIQKVCDAHFAPGVINVMDEPLANPDALTPGVVQAVAGDLAYRCIKRATALALSGEVKAIATAPLN